LKRTVSVADPSCRTATDLGAAARGRPTGIVLDAGKDKRDANGSVRITLRGPLLVVELLPAKRAGKAKPQPICAGGGTVAGVYFPTERPLSAAARRCRMTCNHV